MTYNELMAAKGSPRQFYWQVEITTSGEQRTLCYLSLEVAKQAYRYFLDRGVDARLKKSIDK